MFETTRENFKSLFGFGNDICDVWIRFLGVDLFIWKDAVWNYTNPKFEIGQEVGDGIFAINTPWFMIYPIPNFIYRLFDR